MILQMRYRDLQHVLYELVGQRCEGADNPHGSILRLDIGPLGIRADESAAQPHGWRHLTILSPWRLETRTAVLCDWNESGGMKGTLGGLVQPLVGASLVSAKAQGPGWDLTMEWSNGYRLLVFSDRTEDREDSWVILGTDGLELGAGPALAGYPGFQLKGA